MGLRTAIRNWLNAPTETELRIASIKDEYLRHSDNVHYIVNNIINSYPDVVRMRFSRSDDKWPQYETDRVILLYKQIGEKLNLIRRTDELHPAGHLMYEVI